MMTLNLRYYDPFNEEMVYSSEFPAMSNFFISYEKRVAAGNEPVLMRSTGLKDKNGKEIYEGDRIRSLMGKVGTVEWFQPTCHFRAMNFTRNEAIPHKAWENCEVIGNVWEEEKCLE